MTSITIRTVGNRSLYRPLYESIDSETHHRTARGAARRVRQINKSAETWARTIGFWGTVEVIIDGKKLDTSDALWLCDDESDLDRLEWRWEREIAGEFSSADAGE